MISIDMLSPFFVFNFLFAAVSRFTATGTWQYRRSISVCQPILANVPVDYTMVLKVYK